MDRDSRAGARFEDLGGRYDGPALEQDVLDFWRSERIFERSIEQSSGRPVFTWNEGPPTANGKPGIHHVLARTFKDLYPRYRTMRGYHCTRKAGWDTHGLPVEHEVEKALGIYDKARIEQEVGIEEFTRRCRESVMTYIADWEKMTERMGFWVDLSQAYYTLDNDFIESVWHLLQQIWDKDLMYRGHKVVPYDPRIGATLSSHEVAQGYKEITDPSVYVRFAAKGPVAGHDDVSMLAWTTTPWTLPSNMLLAVGEGIGYSVVRSADQRYLLATDLVARVLGDETETLATLTGADLVGTRYERLFDYLPVPGVQDGSPDNDPWRVVAGDFVTTDDGTGIVHIAPAYGVDDLGLGNREGVPVVHGVGLDGYFLPEVTPVAGMFFKDADAVLVKELKARGLLLREEAYTHNYPHGWRTGDPLIYYAKHAWYIRTSKVKERMVALNQTINWVPKTTRDGRFGNWLENNVDWALSRERFWGTPLPVWTDGDGDYKCIGSVAELEALCGRSLSDLDMHRPAIDAIEFVHPDNGRTYKRVPEVIDCWFDSGAMSYAQWHYPFENKDKFEQHFPADYICEAIDQTRGWFYSLHAIATLVSDSVAYKNVVCLAHIVDGDGKKMSKSKGNILNPYDVFDTVGADALRWYFTARIAPEAQKRISVEIVRDVASSFLNTLWNTYGFFVMYARIDDVDFSRELDLEQRPEMDRWILALLDQTVRTTTAALDDYDAQSAGRAIESFVDDLSNWYVRLNRRRFWKSTDGDDKQSAYLALYQCLETTARLLAPFMPFVAESMYRNLVVTQNPDAAPSVHMAEWPAARSADANDALVADFAVVQQVVALGRSARNDSGHRVRQPLGRMLVQVNDAAAQAAVQRHAGHVLEELNIKSLEASTDGALVDYRLKPNLPKVGKRLGKLIPAVRSALAEADGRAIAAADAAGQSVTLDAGGQSVTFAPGELLIETIAAEGYACAEEGGFLVGLDTRLNSELLREGLAREVIRSVQEARKQAGLDVADRIALSVTGEGAVTDALEHFGDLLMSETLATGSLAADDPAAYETEQSLGDDRWQIRLRPHS